MGEYSWVRRVALLSVVVMATEGGCMEDQTVDPQPTCTSVTKHIVQCGPNDVPVPIVVEHPTPTVVN